MVHGYMLETPVNPVLPRRLSVFINLTYNNNDKRCKFSYYDINDYKQRGEKASGADNQQERLRSCKLNVESSTTIRQSLLFM
jgi:hypothetical protein